MAIQNKLVNILWNSKNVILCGKPLGARRNNIVLLFVAQLDLRMFLYLYIYSYDGTTNIKLFPNLIT